MCFFMIESLRVIGLFTAYGLVHGLTGVLSNALVAMERKIVLIRPPSAGSSVTFSYASTTDKTTN